jgi:hypothetical protein
MMTLSSFFEALNTHEIDPRPRHNAALAERLEHEGKHLPDSAKDEILNSLLPQYLRDVTNALDRGASFAQLCDLLHEFLRTFRGAANNAMVRLRPRTGEEEIARCQPDLATHLYRGHECDALLSILQPDERIVAIDFRTIRTSSNRILSRQDLIERSAPSAVSRLSRWAQNFVSEREIAEAEQTIAEAARAASEPKYGFNDDFGPRGVRR